MEGLATARRLPIDVVRWLRLNGEGGDSIELAKGLAVRAPATSMLAPNQPSIPWTWTHDLLNPLEPSYRASLSVGKDAHAS